VFLYLLSDPFLLPMILILSSLHEFLQDCTLPLSPVLAASRCFVLAAPCYSITTPCYARLCSFLPTSPSLLADSFGRLSIHLHSALVSSVSYSRRQVLAHTFLFSSNPNVQHTGVIPLLNLCRSEFKSPLLRIVSKHFVVQIQH
jgi:hypothetical protein